MSGRERREYPRFEGKFKVDLLNTGDDPNISSWESVVQCTALDISKHGMRLASHYNVPVKSTISIIVYYRGYESICLCDVVWKRTVNDEFLYGLYIKEWSKLDSKLDAQLNAVEEEESKENEARAAAVKLGYLAA